MRIGVTIYRAASHSRAGDESALGGVRSSSSSGGSGQPPVPLVLIHGFPVDHRMWEAVAQRFVAATGNTAAESASGDAERAELSEYAASLKYTAASQTPVFAFEMPGAGSTPVPSREESGEVAADGAYPQALDRMAAAFVDQLHRLGFEKAIWVGLSMGGYAVLALQRLFPESVAGIGLCDTKPDADTAQSRANRLRVALQAVGGAGAQAVMHFAEPRPGDSAFKQSAGFIEPFTAWIREQSPEGIAWRQRMAAGRPEQGAVLSQISTPTLVLSGERDPSSPPAAMRPYADVIPDAFFVAVADAGHFTAVEKPDEVASALVQLVERVGRADASEAAR